MIDRARFIEEWVAGTRIREIAALAGRSTSWVSKLARDLGLSSRFRAGTWRRPLPKRQHRITPSQRGARFVVEYGFTTADAARIVGVTREDIEYEIAR